MSNPLIDVKGLSREYDSGGESLTVLRGIDLAIYAGEMVAIMGSSGSGKSTLMNILGCLDRATAGTYRIAGRDVAELHADEIARLRRKYFGFIFQRYNLLPNLTALGNVEVPAVYDGIPAEARKARASELLTRFGLSGRMTHYPNQLSGGQQQRVSIARALMNGGLIILADEPTGALDEKSGIEVMAALRQLSAEGHTIILVTHDPKVAENAGRIIHIKDGAIISDRRTESRAGRAQKQMEIHEAPSSWAAWRRAFLETFQTSLKYMHSHPLRTFLTMLGIMIGIASVVSVVALGKGAQKNIMESVSEFGVNAFNVYRGTEHAKPLTPADYDALRKQPIIDSATPVVDVSAPIRFANISEPATVQGVGEEFMRVKSYHIVEGGFFSRKAVDNNIQEIVLDTYTRKKLFGAGAAIGNVVFLGGVPLRVIGVINKKSASAEPMKTLKGWIPYTTALIRIKPAAGFTSIDMRAKSSTLSNAVELGINQMMITRHGADDIMISTSNDIVKSIKQAKRATSLLISSVAVISLVVGGIGVMNIMLVAVIERTKEIGVRVAVGARQIDIMQQFLIESILVCLIGGILGLFLALVVHLMLNAVSKEFTMIFSLESILVSFLFSFVIGIIFGFFPARNAARLNPVDALARQ